MALTCCQDHILTESIWFVWSKTSHLSGDRRRCYNAGRTNEQLKIELLSQWKLEAEFRKYTNTNHKPTAAKLESSKKAEENEGDFEDVLQREFIRFVWTFAGKYKTFWSDILGLRPQLVVHCTMCV